jgi:branched-chain amino acid aminotransferase
MTDSNGDILISEEAAEERTAPGYRFAVHPSTAAVPAAAREQQLKSPAFGRVFTDHMAIATWTEGRGWHGMQVGARRPFELDPACAVLHYAQEIFEGLKAYRAADGAITLFRPEQNARRMNASAMRLAMPMVPEELFLNAVETLVRVDSAWVPGGDASLYLRPFMFASEAFLGVKAASEYRFCVIASPVGSYFQEGRKALALWVSDDLNRAGPGGTGAAKCGGNYASSLASQAQAQLHGCDQVVFLDAIEHRWVDELGGMNIFFAFDDGSVLTPPLTGTILAGITRASIIELLARRGNIVREEPYSVDQWEADSRTGRLKEVFTCGTAAVVAPVGTVRTRLRKWQIGRGEGGPLAEQLRQELAAIQRGAAAGPDGWVRRIRP